LTILLVGFASAADLSGHWPGQAELTTQDGTQHLMPAYLDLKQEGTTVTGSGGTQEGSSLPLEDVQFDGKTLSFKVTGPDGRIYKSTLTLVSADQLEGKLEFSIEDGTALSAKLTLKREAAK